MTQNVYLASGALGIGTRYIRSARDDEIERILSLPDDDEVLGLEPPGRGDGVVHQAATADPVQDLGGDRSHTSSLACGHDDDGGGCG